jgi:hypothetical protein
MKEIAGSGIVGQGEKPIRCWVILERTEGRVAPGWAARQRVRSKREKNQVGRAEIE